MRRVHWLLAMAIALVLAGPVAAQSARASGALAEGIDHYQAGRYEQAIAEYRSVQGTDGPLFLGADNIARRIALSRRQ